MSSVRTSQDIPGRPAQKVNHPFVQHLHTACAPRLRVTEWLPQLSHRQSRCCSAVFK